MGKILTLFEKRRQRVRTAIARNARGRLRLSIHRSSQHMYAQVIDDAKGATLVAASTLDADLRKETGATTAAAARVGQLLAERAKQAGVTQVVFDRGGFIYHGRVKALADAAREAGLEF